MAEPQLGSFADSTIKTQNLTIENEYLWKRVNNLKEERYVLSENMTALTKHVDTLTISNNNLWTKIEQLNKNISELNVRLVETEIGLLVEKMMQAGFTQKETQDEADSLYIARGGTGKVFINWQQR
jgi:chromosome segregation ATPase